MLKIANISKSFGKNSILNDISLEVKTGEILGFLGPNGAGKSTTIKIMLRLMFQDAGTVEYNGKPLFTGDPDFFSRVGVMIEEPTLLQELSGWQNITYNSKLRDLSLTQTELSSRALKIGLSENDLNKKTRTYSTGMKQKLAMVISQLHNPDILIYDEPTNGLDPHSIIMIREMLKKLAHEENKAIFISSHLLAEVEKTCDKVAIINNGIIITQGTVDEVIRNNGFKDLEEAFLDLVKS